MSFDIKLVLIVPYVSDDEFVVLPGAPHVEFVSGAEVAGLDGALWDGAALTGLPAQPAPVRRLQKNLWGRHSDKQCQSGVNEDGQL